MERINKYYKRSHISEAKFRHLIRCFSLDVTAKEAARVTGISRRSVVVIFGKLRSQIARWSEQQAANSGNGEANKSYNGSREPPDNPEWDASFKNTVLGIFRRKGKVYIEIVPDDPHKKILQRIIRGKIKPEYVIRSANWRGYDGLIDVGQDRHFCITYGGDNYAGQYSPDSNIESFWNFTKQRLAQFNGLPRHTCYLHIKECEFRFNHRYKNLYQTLLKLLCKDPL